MERTACLTTDEHPPDALSIPPHVIGKRGNVRFKETATKPFYDAACAACPPYVRAGEVTNCWP